MTEIARFFILCLGLSLTVAAGAAPVSWQPAQNTNTPLDVLTRGSLIEAANGTDANAGSVTVNGVEFANTGTLLGQGYTGALAGSSGPGGNYSIFLNGFTYGSGTTTSLTLAGGLLSAGDDYLIQLWFTDLRNCCNERTMTFGSSGSSVNVGAFGDGLGQFVVGRFTADTSSFELDLATNGFANAHLTGYQIRQVPAPGVLGLLGVGLLGFSVCRRRRR